MNACVPPSPYQPFSYRGQRGLGQSGLVYVAHLSVTYYMLTINLTLVTSNSFFFFFPPKYIKPLYVQVLWRQKDGKRLRRFLGGGGRLDTFRSHNNGITMRGVSFMACTV